MNRASKLGPAQVRFAYRLVDAYADDLRYVHGVGIGWLAWDETAWSNEGGDTAAFRAVVSVLTVALTGSPGDRKLMADAYRCESAKAILGILAIARTLPPFYVWTETFDASRRDGVRL